MTSKIVRKVRLSFHMASILQILAFGKCIADGFQRHALGSLVSAGYVDVVAGVATLTIAGLARMGDAATVALAGGFTYNDAIDARTVHTSN